MKWVMAIVLAASMAANVTQLTWRMEDTVALGFLHASLFMAGMEVAHCRAQQGGGVRAAYRIEGK
jgi:hypothetical protein